MMAEVLVHVVYSMLNFSVQDGQSHADAVAETQAPDGRVSACGREGIPLQVAGYRAARVAGTRCPCKRRTRPADGLCPSTGLRFPCSISRWARSGQFFDHHHRARDVAVVGQRQVDLGARQELRASPCSLMVGRPQASLTTSHQRVGVSPTAGGRANRDAAQALMTASFAAQRTA